MDHLTMITVCEPVSFDNTTVESSWNNRGCDGSFEVWGSSSKGPGRRVMNDKTLIRRPPGSPVIPRSP